MVMVRGALEEYLHDDNGNLTEKIFMTSNGEHSIIQLEKGQWHSLKCLESGTIIFEAKDGAYAPLTPEDIMNI